MGVPANKAMTNGTIKGVQQGLVRQATPTINPVRSFCPIDSDEVEWECSIGIAIEDGVFCSSGTEELQLQLLACPPCGTMQTVLPSSVVLQQLPG
jgi:hypothetical protein